VSVTHFRLKQASGWFAAGREVETALRLLSDAAFKLFMWLCLHAERSRGSISASTVAIAHELGKPETQIATALHELLHQGVCHHLHGETIQIADRFWPYQRLPDPAAGLDSAAYIERIKQALLTRACVRSVFTPADEKLATTLHHRRVPFEHIERAILLGCMRKYLTLLNHNGGTPITTLHYFTGLLDEVERLEISPDYWQYVAFQVKRLEQRWRSVQCGAAPTQETK
jgi:hypothetical protein